MPDNTFNVTEFCNTVLSKISPDATESPSSFTKDKVAPSVNDACTSTINLITSVVPVSVLF